MATSRTDLGSPPETVVFGYPDATRALNRVGSGALVASNRTAFRRMLAEGPSVVVVFAPPATEADIGAVAHERSSRSDMRALLIDRPTDSQQRLTALRAGFDEAIPAGLPVSELAARIELLAEHARRERAAPRVELGPQVMLDPEARSLVVAGRSVHLRPREYELLAAMAAHPGRTYRRAELLREVGAMSTVRQHRAVDVHVRWLRAKLAPAGADGPRLETIRGVGYRLNLAVRPSDRPAR
jgi:DNA-binding response OmpR family regulator